MGKKEKPKYKPKAKEKYLEAVLSSCEDSNILAPDYCFITDDDKFLYAVNKYIIDKEKYLSTGIWPKRGYLERDMVWIYYYYLKITDYSLELDKYFDFDYDTNKWTKDELISILNKYGKVVLFSLAIYLNLKVDESFDEWHVRYENTEYDAIKNAEEFIESQKTTGK